MGLSVPPQPALDDWARALEAEGVEVERQAEVTSKWDLAGWLRLRGSIARARPDLVHVHLVHPTADRYVPWAVPPRAGLVTTEHVRHEVPERTQRWLKRAASRRVDVSVAVAGSVEKSLVQHYGLRPGRVRLVRNGVDLERFRSGLDRVAARTRLGLPAGAYIMGSAGRLTRQKGFDILLQAMQELRGDWALAIAGDGEDGGALREQAHALGIAERVHWLGPVADMPVFYAALDAFALASRWEGLPITLLEALACGVATVATAVDGAVEVLADGSGLLVPSEDPVELGRVLDLWRASVPLRERSAAHAVAARARQDWNVTRASYFQVYEDACARRRR